MENLAVIEYRRQAPMARMMALVLNALTGGKDPNPKPSDNNKIPWSEEEFLFPWAMPDGITRAPGITKETAEAFFELNKKGLLPDWAVGVSPLAALRAARGS